MTQRILVIGGYGNFGQFISRMLARAADIQVIIGGRDKSKADALAQNINAANAVQTVYLDINRNLASVLQDSRPCVVIHTSGPFQNQGYAVAQCCVEQGCHYVDLADGREFVTGISALHQAAKNANLLVCSGASSVPSLTSAIMDRYGNEFSVLLACESAISTAQKTSRGLATTEAVLSYAGKRFLTLVDGTMQPVYGWLDLRHKPFYQLGKRLLGNCDIPDLALFPQRYPSLQRVRFQAGLELPLVHGVLFGLSWLVRLKLLASLQPLAKMMLNISRWLDPFGSEESGFYMELFGLDQKKRQKCLRFELVAHQGDGMYIPAVPSILMALKLARGEIKERGAFPCMGFISLEEYLGVLSEFKIEWRLVDEPDARRRLSD
ncbi:MAG TPA: saccharopine dehydrogenase NADP-binding domain-containing protein [Pseudomonadales bacterium]|nr:saccharopine dehydrogenase NADP-binding domain-containing protein [Pseudomonadales bacterium]